MKNLNNHLAMSSIDFFDEVVAPKKSPTNDPHRKRRLLGLSARVSSAYTDYDSKHSSNTLPSLTQLGVTATEKEDLLSLYSYNSKKLTEFRNGITTDSSSNYQSTCQFCTINSVSSLDHFAPKDDFPEFSVHPHNLLPCCTECNSKKSKQWLLNNQHKFLNLYIDKLPTQQYLFVDLTVISLNDIEVEFKLDNPHGIPTEIYSIITSHYNNLELFKRFNEKSGDIITDLSDTIITHLQCELSINQIKKTTLLNLQNRKVHKGVNHYQIILEEALMNSKEFLSLFNSFEPTKLTEKKPLE
jgi:5-methylcytosine-specific restriction endonuclease McrA